MCFIVGEYKEKIAREDIEVYKIITSCGKSACRYFQYDYGKLYFVPALNCKDVGRAGFPFYVIHEGFHSYKIEECRDQFAFEGDMFPREDTITVKCIIPKGAKYYHNTQKREYVSTQIVILSKEVL